MAALPRSLIVILACAAVLLGLFPLVGDSFYIRLVTKILVLGLFALSLDLLVGFTGLVSLGHAAFYGTAGYAVATLINKAGMIDFLPLLALALLAAAAAALVIGWISVRTSGIYFIMITLALAQMLHYFFHDVSFWGGADGLNLISRPQLRLGSLTLLDFSNRVATYYFVLALLVLVFIGLVRVLRAPFGQILRGIRVNEARTRALGHNVQHYKLAAFVLAGTLAGLAGVLEVTRAAFISPAHLGWHESGLVLVVVILGGMGTLYGPLLGAFTLVLLEDTVSDLTERWPLVMGLFVIGVVLFLPHGLAGLARRFRWLHATARAPVAEVAPQPALAALSFRDSTAAEADIVLETQGLTKQYGGLRAVGNVSLRFARGQVHAILGPNGAGKTTLINLLSGDVAPSGGRILYQGHDITDLPVERVSRLGIGRSYQKTNIFGELTTFENVWIGAQARLPGGLHLWRPALGYPEVVVRTHRALEMCGLAHRADVPASALSHGEQRQLEIGMMLATEPDLLLLDEPLAGMGADESQQMVGLLRRLAQDHTLILIEHDMDAVFAVADRITVMVNGQELETGDVATIRASAAVRDAYLGEEEGA